MKLISLRLHNFRQFYGTTPDIYLASGAENITLFHGNNGAGKTTLLNAFTWVLYEKFTAAFNSPELLINKRAISEVKTGTSVECHAEIYFEHENKQYQLKRQCYACQDKDNIIQYSQSKLFMLIAGDDGRWTPPLEQPDEIINRILPESLHQYFFFDGERIDHIFRSESKHRIAEDTKELLGVKVLDRAIDHSKAVKRKLQDELKKIGDIETKKLVRQQNKQEKHRDNLLIRQQEITQELSQQDTQKKSLNEQLLALQGAEELQTLKVQLEQQEQSLRNQLIKGKKELKGLISGSGYTVLTQPLTQKFWGIIQDLRDRGELPTGIKQRFVQGLLDQKRCICGTELSEGTPAQQAVQTWMNKAGIADVEEAAIHLEARVTELETQIPVFWQEVDRIQANREQQRQDLARVENELDNVKQKLRKYPDQAIQQLQKQLDEIETKIRHLTLEQGRNQQEIDEIDTVITDLEKQISKQQQRQNKQTLAQRRIDATQEVITRLTEVRTRLENQFRRSLELRVQEIFSSISFTPYQPRLSPDYELTLIENTSGIAVPVAASTGENQILSLSFIGGIIDRVREWSQRKTLMGPDSSTFPVVMDSPFGSLDEIYRRHVAQSLPQLANQLIILVTKTQSRGEVETEIKPYIGKEYVLVYHSPKPDCEKDSLEINGVTYPLVKRSADQYEYTEIMEISR
ncbi:AAA family ATPase [Spirulina sp. CS-785/01]|uniref:AAA family ATPase n=1 Tax=Spirulina sp. CS-785/01 TaxID=3021716 RepID=UPI00232D16B8|nr:AAA family ATPase [Spirulina sp. CS-785/01]MDB9313913.1 AAA family ATPase [Spirulina sp. CS-785/01]